MSCFAIGPGLDSRWCSGTSSICYQLLSGTAYNLQGMGYWSGSAGSYTFDNGIYLGAYSATCSVGNWMLLRGYTLSGYDTYSTYASLINNGMNYAYRNDSYMKQGYWFAVPGIAIEAHDKHLNGYSMSKMTDTYGYGLYAANMIYNSCVVKEDYSALLKTLPWFMQCAKTDIILSNGITSSNFPTINFDNYYNISLDSNHYYQPVFNNNWYTPTCKVTNNNNFPLRLSFNIYRSDNTLMKNITWIVGANETKSQQFTYDWETKTEGSMTVAAMDHCSLVIEKASFVKTDDSTFSPIKDIKIKIDDTNGFVKAKTLYVKTENGWKEFYEGG